MAKELGNPVECQSSWLWTKRQNHTYRPNRPLTEQEEAQTVSFMFHVSACKSWCLECGVNCRFSYFIKLALCVREIVHKVFYCMEWFGSYVGFRHWPLMKVITFSEE